MKKLKEILQWVFAVVVGIAGVMWLSLMKGAQNVKKSINNSVDEAINSDDDKFFNP